MNTYWSWQYFLRGVVWGLNHILFLSLMVRSSSSWCTFMRKLLDMVAICLLHHILLMHHWIILLLEVVTGKIVLKILEDVVMTVIFAWLCLFLALKLIMIHHHILVTLVLQLIRKCLGVEQLEPLYPFEACKIFTFLDHLVSSLHLNITVIFHSILLVLGELGPIFLYEWRFNTRLRSGQSPSTQSLLGRWSYSCHLVSKTWTYIGRGLLLVTGQHTLQLFIILVESTSKFHGLFVHAWRRHSLLLTAFLSTTKSYAIFYAINIALVLLNMWWLESICPLFDLQLLRVNLSISTSSKRYI